MNLEELRALHDAIALEIGKAVQGQDEIVELLLVSLFARGHCLIEGPPGTAKTLLAQSLSATLPLHFNRIQFTPDLMPGDVIGSNVFNFQTHAFELVKGPIFCDVLLADEINRAPPKTQAALLQVMNEHRVTIDGTDHPVGDVFFVVATQNPIEQQGTYPLPEAQLDRFLFKLGIDFPDAEAEFAILQRHAGQPLDHDSRKAAIRPVAGLRELRAGQSLVDGIRLDDSILRYVLDIARATRAHVDIAFGVSTRAADALCGAVRALAALSGRDYAIPDDVKRLVVPTFRHRIVLSPSAEIEGRDPVSVLGGLLALIEAPR